MYLFFHELDESFESIKQLLVAGKSGARQPARRHFADITECFLSVAMYAGP
jgi:hypothetical protein